MAYKFNPFTGNLDVVGPVLTGTGTVSAAADGTEALPGISFANDLDTGITRTGNDEIAISTGGNVRLFIDSSGNVGIGATTPGMTLEVKSAEDAGKGIRINEIADTYHDLISSGGNLYIHADSRGDDGTGNVLRFGVGSTGERARIDSSGRLGIGTTSPQGELTISKAGAEGIELRPGVISDQNRFIHYNRSTSAYIDVIHFADNHIWFKQGSSEAARIDSSGRLLVGTSTSRSTGAERLVQIEGTSAVTTGLSIIRNSNDIFGSEIRLGKSRGTSNNSSTIISDDDTLAQISFSAADGVDINSVSASISAEVDGTPGADDTPGRLVFSTTADGASSPDPRMTIKNAGDVLIGTQTLITQSTSSGDGVRIAASGQQFLIADDAPALFIGRNTSDGDSVDFRRAGVKVGTISVTASATAYNTSSDYRLKENVIPLTDAVDRLNQLQVHRFNFIADPDTTVDGFLAHEAQDVVPECVTGTKDEVDDEGNPVYQGIDQSKIVPLVVAALQEALAEIETLKTRLADAGIS